MKHIALFLLLLVAGFFIAVDAQQCLFINEVYTRPAASGTNGNPCDTGEWVELYNASSVGIDIGCYSICTFESQSGTDRGHCVTVPTGAVIPAGGYYLIGGNGSICPTCDFTSGALNLNWHAYACASNMVLGVNQSCGTCGVTNRHQFLGVFHDSGEDIALFDGNGVLVDAVTYGSRGNRGAASLANMAAAGGCSARTLSMPASANVAYEFMGPSGGAGSGFERTSNGGMTWASTTIATATPGSSNGPTVACTPLVAAFTHFIATGSGGETRLEWEIPSHTDLHTLALEISEDATDFRPLHTWASPAHAGLFVHAQATADAWYRLTARDADGGVLASATVRHTRLPDLAPAQVGVDGHILTVIAPVDASLRVVGLDGRIHMEALCVAQSAAEVPLGHVVPGIYVVDVVNAELGYRSLHKVVIGMR